MKTNTRQGEQIIKEGTANRQKGRETLGGNLCLTNQRLVFEANKYKVHGGTTEVELPNIQSSKTGWKKLLRFICLFPNSLEVRTRLLHLGSRH
jgi:hypothetical protein